MNNSKQNWLIVALCIVTYFVAGCSAVSKDNNTFEKDNDTFEIEASQTASLFYQTINIGDIEGVQEILEKTTEDQHPDLFVDYYVYTGELQKLTKLYEAKSEQLTKQSHRKIFRFLNNKVVKSSEKNILICQVVDNIKKFNEFSIEVYDDYQKCTL